jgi:thiol:disulfide interchange protein DsbC
MNSASHPLLRRAAVAAAIAWAVAFGAPATAQTPAPAVAAPAAADASAALRKTLEQKFPGSKIGVIAKTPYFGLFEVQLDDTMLYTDARAAYVLVGSVYESNSKKNMTEARLRELNRVPLDTLPYDLAFKRVKGDGSRKLVIFSDADCPFCARLENELKSVDNVTIYTFLFPIDQLHPDAARKSKIIWCSADRAKAWDAFFDSGKLPDNKGECENPVDATQALGRSLRISATPTLLFADGSLVPGALPKDRLEAEMKQAEAEAKKLAAGKK